MARPKPPRGKGNVGSPLLPDITPPAVPSGLAAVPASSTQINVSWNPSADVPVTAYVTSGISGYKLYRNGNVAYSGPSLSFSDTNLAPATTNSYRVSAYDVAGNESAQSSIVQATTNAPTGSGIATVSWAAPTTNTDGSPLTGPDAIAKYRVSWYLGGVFVNSAIVLAPTTTATISDLAPGTYTFYVTAIAVDGEESNPALIGTKVIS